MGALTDPNMDLIRAALGELPRDLLIDDVEAVLPRQPTTAQRPAKARVPRKRAAQPAQGGTAKPARPLIDVGPCGAVIDPREWWTTVSEGMNGRPKPGTRVRITPSGKEGTVEYYEGCWNDRSFPVRVDGDPVVRFYSTRSKGRRGRNEFELVGLEIIAGPQRPPAETPAGGLSMTVGTARAVEALKHRADETRAAS